MINNLLMDFWLDNTFFVALDNIEIMLKHILETLIAALHPIILLNTGISNKNTIIKY